MPAVRKQDALCDNFLYCGKDHTDKPSSCHQDWPHSNGQQWTTPLNVSPPRPNKACLPSQRSLPKFLFKRQRDAVSLSANPVLQPPGGTGETTCGKNPHYHPVRFAHVSNGVRGSAPKPFYFPPENMPILKACPPSGRGVSSSQPLWRLPSLRHQKARFCRTRAAGFCNALFKRVLHSWRCQVAKTRSHQPPCHQHDAASEA